MEELLIRFEDKTHILRVPTLDKFEDDEKSIWLISLWSERTGWSRNRLRVSSWQSPFVHISTISSVLGGKGGFGTLLKGQSRQAGAKLTTDFGACRDLQGRRLRHVNDEIKLRKWREMEKRKQAGEAVPDDELWKTPTGLYNWHLMTPTWADISKKATHRIKRQFQKIDQEAQKDARMKKEQEEAYQKSMTMYLDQATSAVESIKQNIPDAIKQGLQAASEKKRKRAESTQATERNPDSLCTLSGDIVMAKGQLASSRQIQSKSDFGTAVLVLDFSPPIKTAIIYYEVVLVTGGLAQIGWASLVGEQSFSPNNDLGDGVGDDDASYGVDGSRSLKFHGGREEPYSLQWKKGDRLGCLFDSQKRVISFTINGEDTGKAFSTPFYTLFPALSCNQGQILELITAKTDCRFFPEADAIAVQDLLCEHHSSSKRLGVLSKSKRNSDEFEASDQKGQGKSSALQKPTIPLRPSEGEIRPEPLDLAVYQSAKELELLGLDRLKSALIALQVKCGGTLAERAARLFSLKGLERREFPVKVRASGFVE